MLQQQQNGDQSSFIMLSMTHNKQMKMSKSRPKSRTSHFSINDQPDILVEVLKRLDGRSLGVASCVCRLWHSISKSDDSVWEYVCFRHVSPSPPPSVRPLIRALGGYKRLYMVCVRPALRRANKNKLSSRRVWTRQGAQLLLSLFCVDYYEKLGATNNNNASNNNNSASSSLMFLCKPVNV